MRRWAIVGGGGIALEIVSPLLFQSFMLRRSYDAPFVNFDVSFDARFLVYESARECAEKIREFCSRKVYAKFTFFPS